MKSQGCRCASNPGLKLANAFGVIEFQFGNSGFGVGDDCVEQAHITIEPARNRWGVEEVTSIEHIGHHVLLNFVDRQPDSRANHEILVGNKHLDLEIVYVLNELASVVVVIRYGEIEHDRV